MPLHDYECTECGHVHEEFIEWDNHTCLCRKCGAQSKRVYLSFNGIKHDAPSWMKDTLEIVDKDGGNHCQEFLKHPSRGNYNNWLKGEKLRPMEPGEKISKKKASTDGLRRSVHSKFRKDNSIEVRK